MICEEEEDCHRCGIVSEPNCMGENNSNTYRGYRSRSWKDGYPPVLQVDHVTAIYLRHLVTRLRSSESRSPYKKPVANDQKTPQGRDAELRLPTRLR